jgi:hypothetical protein
MEVAENDVHQESVVPYPGVTADQGVPSLSPRPAIRRARIRKPRDRSKENLGKRWLTLLNIMRHLKQEYGAEVYTSISVPRKGKNYVYMSVEDVSPLLRHDIVRTPPLPTSRPLC